MYENIDVVGFKYRDGNFTPNILETGNITLEKEPDNNKDPNAIKVLVDGVHVGYVSKNTYSNINIEKVKNISVVELYQNSASCKIEYKKRKLPISKVESKKDDVAEMFQSLQARVDALEERDREREECLTKLMNKLKVTSDICEVCDKKEDKCRCGNIVYGSDSD